MASRKYLRQFAGLILAALLPHLSCESQAQPCEPSWTGGNSLPGVHGKVLALTTWDPDGSTGNQPRMIVAGGAIDLAGDVFASRIAVFHPNHNAWSALGSGVNGNVSALTSLANASGGEDLIVGGSFTVAGGVPVSSLAKWDGYSWSGIGGGIFGGTVKALASIPRTSGGADLYVGGTFTTAGSTAINYIAKWDGSVWSTLGAGVDGGVTSLKPVRSSTGGFELLATGNFRRAGTSTSIGVASWNGSTWTPYYQYLYPVGVVNAAAGVPSATTGIDVQIATTAEISNFPLWGTTIVQAVHSWVNGVWNRLGGTFQNKVVSLAAVASPTGNYDIFAGVEHYDRGLFHFSAGAWRDQAVNGQVVAMTTIPNSAGGEDLIIGGLFSAAGGIHASNIARLSGTTWTALGQGVNSPISSLARVRDASSTYKLVAGRYLFQPGGGPVSYLAYFDGSTWRSFGGGVNGMVRTMLVVPQSSGADHLIIGGDFTAVGGVPAKYVALWNGTAWSAYGAGFDAGVLSLAFLPNSSGGTDLIASGAFQHSGTSALSCVARWDGILWQPMDAGLTFYDIRSQPIVTSVIAIPRLSGGVDLFAAGHFDRSGATALKSIAMWNGNAWVDVGGGVSGLRFPFPFSFDTWEVNKVHAMEKVPNTSGGTDLIVAGFFTGAGGVPTTNIARWDGLNWAPLGLGIGSRGEAVSALAKIRTSSGS